MTREYREHNPNDLIGLFQFGRVNRSGRISNVNFNVYVNVDVNVKF
jgi:hypothetical protein